MPRCPLSATFTWSILGGLNLKKATKTAKSAKKTDKDVPIYNLNGFTHADLGLPPEIDALGVDLPNRKIFMSQADRLIEKFGGAPNLARILEAVGRPISVGQIFSWPKKHGFIPCIRWPDLFLAAQYEGIIFTADDFDPRPKPAPPPPKRRKI